MNPINTGNESAIDHLRARRDADLASGAPIPPTNPTPVSPIRPPRIITQGVSVGASAAPPAPSVPPKKEKKGPSKTMKTVVAILLLLVAVLIALLLMQSCTPEGEIIESKSGVELVDTNGMTDEEAQNYIDDLAREGLMDVSFAEKMTLTGDSLYIAFTNNETNKHDQVLTIIQDGKSIFNTHPLEPGYKVADITLPETVLSEMHAGEAQVSVSYVDSEGEAMGNSTLFPVEIVIAE